MELATLTPLLNATRSADRNRIAEVIDTANIDLHTKIEALDLSVSATLAWTLGAAAREGEASGDSVAQCLIELLRSGATSNDLLLGLFRSLDDITLVNEGMRHLIIAMVDELGPADHKDIDGAQSKRAGEMLATYLRNVSNDKILKENPEYAREIHGWTPAELETPIKPIDYAFVSALLSLGADLNARPAAGRDRGTAWDQALHINDAHLFALLETAKRTQSLEP